MDKTRIEQITSKFPPQIIGEKGNILGTPGKLAFLHSKLRLSALHEVAIRGIALTTLPKKQRPSNTLRFK